MRRRAGVEVVLPGEGRRLQLEHAVFDLNGTLTRDGELLPEVPELMEAVRHHYRCWILTADTFGRARYWSDRLGVPVEVVQDGREKAEWVRKLSGGVAAVGNGRNDVAMFAAATLAVAVLSPEGTAAEALRAADIVVPTIQEALRLLVYPERLIATLRE
ncbi:MAG: haloacid dehalogenase [Firmicutes bacterium]|nr:haloacid dehalogenase [Alicyclobacillaceae bacterium]MCL6497416.1 haloacid dehalogenase [Bacillota bacterium]